MMAHFTSLAPNVSSKEKVEWISRLSNLLRNQVHHFTKHFRAKSSYFLPPSLPLPLQVHDFYNTPLKDLRKAEVQDVFHRMFKFTFVRHPFER